MQKLFLLTGFVLLSLWGNLPEPDMTVRIPMRDGTELPTDIYLPQGYAAKETPCILVRSAAGRKALPALSALPLRDAGYVIAIQDTRSKIDTEGKTMPCLDDGWGCRQDGYDTVQWLADSPYSNGSIGTYGPSALGIVQLMLAPSQPPALKSQYIQFACANVFDHAAYPGGQFHKHQIESWFHYYANHPSIIETVKKERAYSPFWSKMNALPRSDKVNVPAVFIAGWYDTFLQGTIDAFLKRQHEGAPGARGQQKLIIGPWSHFWPAETRLGDYTVPEKGYAPPYDLSPAKWFAATLKGETGEIAEAPSIQYYVMGPFDAPSKGNVWKTADTWPPKAVTRRWYLTATKELASIPSQEASFTYLYDPNNPIPTLGGRNLFIESGPKDQRPIESRDDLVLFLSAPLAEDLEVTGFIKADLFFSTDADDTDVIVRLTDVYPDGRSLLVSDNAYRLGFHKKTPNQTDPHRVRIDLHSTSLVFAKGHRIGLSISSSNYPRFEKNLNVALNDEGEAAASPKIARNTIYVGEDHPSSLILPIVE